MLSLTALLQTKNDALRLGRCLETAYPCDEIVILDHGSTDATLQVAREYGARIVSVCAETDTAFAFDASRLSRTAWLLCLDPRESLSEALAASLFEWKSNGSRLDPVPHAIFLREENANGWLENPIPQTRLVPAGWQHWNGVLPANQLPSTTLDGRLLRFSFP